MHSDEEDDVADLTDDGRSEFADDQSQSDQDEDGDIDVYRWYDTTNHTGMYPLAALHVGGHRP